MKPPSSRGPRRARSAAPGLPAIRGEVRSAPARDTPETLETPRLLLEPWQERRIEDFINLTGDERVMRYIGPGRVWTRAEPIDRFHAAADHWRTQAFG